MSLQELEKSIASCKGCPIAICLSKRDVAREADIAMFRSRINEIIIKIPADIRVFSVSCKDANSVTEMINWLLSKTKSY
jgi:ethanolamine utilization protein EutP (predicted NTPase)